MSDKNRGKLDSLKDKLRFPRRNAKEDEGVKGEPEQLPDTVPVVEGESDVTATDGNAAKYRQMLERIVIDGLLHIAEEKLSDANFVESVFSKAYELLPTPVRMVVSRQWCLRYLHSRKAPLLLQLQQYQAARAESGTLTGPKTGNDSENALPATPAQAPPAT